MVLIKKIDKVVEPEVPQEANALALANARTKEGLPPLVNILRIEDPSEKTGISIYVLLKPLRTDNSVLCDFVGFKIGKTQINAFNSFEDVANYVSKKLVSIVNIRAPWTRIINIENITYKHSKE
jgi:hypothetical protein